MLKRLIYGAAALTLCLAVVWAAGGFGESRPHAPPPGAETSITDLNIDLGEGGTELDISVE